MTKTYFIHVKSESCDDYYFAFHNEPSPENKEAILEQILEEEYDYCHTVFEGYLDYED